MTDTRWIGNVLMAARPQAMAALLRHFRDLETAEEAFQEASLRALRAWPKNGPPRDAAAWLIMVGRNAAIDAIRRRRSENARDRMEGDDDLARRVYDGYRLLAEENSSRIRTVDACGSVEQIAAEIRLIVAEIK